MKKHLSVIAVSLLLIAVSGCAGCALFQDEGQSDWETEPAPEGVQA